MSFELNSSRVDNLRDAETWVQSILKNPKSMEFSGLSVVSRILGSEILVGRHRSLHPGSSSEFKDHKNYFPGDDIKEVNWKVYAKTRRLFVRRREQEVSISSSFFLDCSASMSYGQAEDQKWSAAVATALLISLSLIAQNDRVKIAWPYFEEPATANLNLFASLISKLLIKPPVTKENPLEQIEKAAKRVGRSIFWVISDFFVDPDELASLFYRLKARGVDLRPIIVMHGDELDFPFYKPALFEGLESEGELEVFPEALAATYRKEVKNHLSKLENHFKKLGLPFMQIVSTNPLIEQLSTYLKRKY